ncbi:MAG: inositol monophosphatase family protein [Anaerolineae bacterium]|jgi:myo-inositol-1(or 4)-monophosphatase|nr:inositol monophosphatase family protein [Anaerolineae bacterium]
MINAPETYTTWLMVATDIAYEAGALLKTHWRSGDAVHSKGYRNIVTAADLAAEELILTRLRAAFPNHTITSEEAGADIEDTPARWYVDPLDGTTNFAHNNPNFCVSIAATREGIPVVGVIYDPLRDFLFAATRNGGATLNNAPIHCSGITALSEATFAADWPRDPQPRLELWARASRLMVEARTLRVLGAAALNMAYVAAGWFDLYLARTLSPWDMAAGVLIAQEAGAVASTLNGAPWTLEHSDLVLAATPALLQTWLQLED